jgi:ADP-heptose:LPS heptosyltransferase
MSLAKAFKTDISSIPETARFEVNQAKRTFWQKRIQTLDNESIAQKPLKIGIAWSGNPKQMNNASRSFSLNDLQKIFALIHCRFYSLQKGEAAMELKRTSLPIVDLGSEIIDWEDTAAIIEHLDLVISPCTAIAHLSATLNKRTWVLLCAPCDWRWLLDREDSPWYPSVRLFCQSYPQAWEPVMNQVTQALEEFSSRYKELL